MKEQPIAVALAIIEQEGKFLLQLRDDIPNIRYPGHWGLFGGHLEPEETPEAALIRELLEEIDYQAIAPTKFRCYNNNEVIRHIYHVPLKVSVEALALNEGWDLRLVELADIQRGNCYSPKANEVRPLGRIHQQILLDFITSR
jgi:8-oxo-dGTP pyrophosphatase MutT (NUDIX family)